MTAKDQKKRLRMEILQKISALGEDYCARANEQILERLSALPAYQEAGTVFSFVGGSHEINTRPFLERVLSDKKRLCVPLCQGRGIMSARLIHSLDDLRPGRYGLLEPDPASEEVSAREISLAVIPCLACSRKGVRLGHGGGYYDRYFQFLQIPTVMLCREKLLSEDIPREAHDLIFETVLTEKGLFENGSAR